MYVLVEIKGKQYKAEKGGLLKVDKINADKGTSVDFSSVMLAQTGEDVKIGTPFLKDVCVKGVVEDHQKDKKINVIKYKKRKRYRRRYGHRQAYSYIRVNDIVGV